jgi:hypothetical protein
MPLYRAQVTTEQSAGIPRDHFSNTIHFNDIGPTSDPDNIAQDTAQAFADFNTSPAGWDRYRCKLYDLADPEPRNPVAEQVVTVVPAGTPNGPREVVLCLSFYSQQNRPRWRGRLYLGPWALPYAERPTDPFMTQCLDLATALGNVGGVDVDWCVYSTMDNAARPITNAWCDNEWDTMRSRGMRATARMNRAIGEMG